ncbi:MauE/DoxX family redox-associated membrane protein [Microbacterium oxydans]|uniref:MauE/DoxX family redox-associated membrane protein n=1 Tax=Microbacterium oxydans TaxID=82380 RepID=UPI0018CF2860|nr:MauE/DoxX family redox-associated membrane protein [Microbacterium oxydans]
MSTLGYALSALVGLILVFTGVLKLREGRKLGETIARYRVLPPPMVRLTASFLPPIELAVGLCLVLGITGPWPFAAAGLIVIYTSAVVSVITRRISTDCGCFGSVLRSQANWVVVGRNAVMMLALLPSILLPPAALIEGWVGWCLVGVATLAGLTRALSPDQHTAKEDESAAPRTQTVAQRIGDPS